MEDGLTLMEVLVALVLSSLLAMGLVGVLVNQHKLLGQAVAKFPGKALSWTLGTNEINSSNCSQVVNGSKPIVFDCSRGPSFPSHSFIVD